MAGRKKVDVSKMSPEDRAAYEKRLEAARAPKPAYLAYTVNEDGTINVGTVTRSAEEILAAVDEDRSLKYTRIMVK